ncbi:MAG: hypothetical protein JSU05_01555, partial [Bacteroidetes bacterium]|nr:hypothetical protein [Bacteroidota bacterium]
MKQFRSKPESTFELIMQKIKFSLAAIVGIFFMTTTAIAQPAKVVADKIAAVVGDRIILLSDIQNTIADAARQGTDLPDDAECTVTEQALVSKVMMLQAEKDS